MREIDPGAGTFAALGFLDSTNFDDAYTMVDSIDDAGEFIDTKPGARAPVWKTVLKQTTKDEIDLMKDAAGKYFEVYYKVQLNNANYQEFLAPVCRIKPGMALAFAAATERKIEIEIHFLWLKSALTRTPTAYNTTAGQYYILVEGASATGVPTDAATVPQAAI